VEQRVIVFMPGVSHWVLTCQRAVFTSTYYNTGWKNDRGFFELVGTKALAFGNTASVFLLGLICLILVV